MGFQRALRHGTQTTRHAGRRAITLSETLIIASILGFSLVAAAVGLTTIRTELKRHQTVQLLQTLDTAVSAYHAATGEWPCLPAPATASADGDQDAGDAGSDGTQGDRATDPLAGNSEHIADRGERDRSGDAIIALLAAVSASRQALADIPDVLRTSETGGSPSVGAVASLGAGAWDSVHDAWGQHLLCLTHASRAAVDREAVVANGGRPVFISAGEDRDFGRVDRAAAGDNLRSDELPR